jgi:DnaK suppressor protein
MSRYKQILESKVAEIRWNTTALAGLGASLLRRIEEALLRIDHGTFGLCLDCGMPLSTARLEAVPWASYCIRCQDLRGSSPD